MVAETEHSSGLTTPDENNRDRDRLSKFGRMLGRYRFSSLTRRIIILNVIALLLMVSGVLYLNQFRAGLIDARVSSLLTQGEIIAGAISASAPNPRNSVILDPDRMLGLKDDEAKPPADDGARNLEFPINPERAAPILRRLIEPTKTRAKIYDPEGVLIVDSFNIDLSDQILSENLPQLGAEKPNPLVKLWRKTVRRLFVSDLPVYKELGPDQGKDYPEVTAALSGASVSIVRVNKKREMIVSVAVPVQRYRVILGALVLSTRGGDIDAIIQAERWAIMRMFLVALTVTVLLSILLAGTIAGPVRRLAAAAERVKAGRKTRVEIPDFTSRRDEIGELSGALRDMTTALYNRIDAIERFAADVAHELKNPLTSLRSAVETLPLVKSRDAQRRLIDIVQDDVRRLDRLISDISNASRLDAELAREDAAPVDLADMLTTVISLTNDTAGENDPEIVLDIADAGGRRDLYVINGQESRLGQVMRNLLDNATSFSPPGGTVRVSARRTGREIEIKIEDDGPGIRPESLEKVFDRFHTDRPGEDAFGKNSGLGLSISRQILESHGGRIWAENRLRPVSSRPSPDTAEQRVCGARFVVRLPAVKAAKK